MGRLNKYDRCEKGERAIALEHSKRKHVGQRFIFNMGAAKRLCLQNNQAEWLNHTNKTTINEWLCKTHRTRMINLHEVFLYVHLPGSWFLSFLASSSAHEQTPDMVSPPCSWFSPPDTADSCHEQTSQHLTAVSMKTDVTPYRWALLNVTISVSLSTHFSLRSYDCILFKIPPLKQKFNQLVLTYFSLCYHYSHYY